MMDCTDQVKLTEERSKSSSSYLLFIGLRYISVFDELIHEILKFELIESVNTIFTFPFELP